MTDFDEGGGGAPMSPAQLLQVAQRRATALTEPRALPIGQKKFFSQVAAAPAPAGRDRVDRERVGGPPRRPGLSPRAELLGAERHAA